ncbi:MAG: diaminopimelate epimerase [Proteobacteria bacterium]|nr:diaminopimelate epimerase [Pseudomonadota bacterium]
MRNGFFKGHGLGNDYLALDPAELDFRVTPRRARLLCDRHEGVGGDGVLLLAASRKAHFGLRIFNPDGSEAEKSGNGLRIFARYLYATGRTRRRRFRVETRGGLVDVALHLDRHGEAGDVTVGIGRARFEAAALPCTLSGELVDRELDVGGRRLRFTGVSVGNPHCVVFREPGESWTAQELRELGPELEHHAVFPRRTNVQLAVATGPRALRLLIWERGAGETAASGTSACAAAAAAVRVGRVKSPVTVASPGGSLWVEVADDGQVTLRGPVAEVARGRLSAALVRRLRR